MTVALRPFERVPWEVPVLVLIKLIVHPVVALLLLTALGPFDPNWVATAVLMAALPPALNVFVLARQYDAWVEPASGSVLLGTLLSVATLTTVMWLVQHGVVCRNLCFADAERPCSRSPAFWSSISPRCCRVRSRP